MKIYDISMPIDHDMAVYKNKEDKKPILKITRDFAEGGSRESNLSLDLHTGTHLDAPLHMIPGGNAIDKLELNMVVRQCKVFDLTLVQEKITHTDLRDKNIAPGDFLILKTSNSFDKTFDPDFVYLDQSGAEYLAMRQITGVGIDALGIERNQPGHNTHKILLSHGIIILEGLRLHHIAEGEYLLCAAPINIAGAEAAPVRAVLIVMTPP